MASQDYYRLLREFGQGKIDILAGTQILAKGLHFPNVTLVGVVSADTCLYMPDFRANERTFQLTSQVAGRAGRSEKRGVVFVQTYFPEQPAVKFAMVQDFEGFVREEMKHRAGVRPAAELAAGDRCAAGSEVREAGGGGQRPAAAARCHRPAAAAARENPRPDARRNQSHRAIPPHPDHRPDPRRRQHATALHHPPVRQANSTRCKNCY